jgi:hypothetical protein
MDIDLNFGPHDNGSPTHAQRQETGGGVEQMQLYEQGDGYQMHVQVQAQKEGESTNLSVCTKFYHKNMPLATMFQRTNNSSTKI